jgi:hypothetical protein
MTTYYTLNPDGSIAASADFCFQTDENGACACMTTDKEIVHGYDGRLYFAGEEPAKPDDLVKQERMAPVNAEAENRLAAFLREHGWDSLGNVLGQTGQFAADAPVAQREYDRLWAAVFAVQARVENDEMNADEAIATLPELAWEG